MTRARDLAAFVSNADGDIKFDTDTLFIDSSANKVGIGTTSPAHPLDVDGEVRFNSNIRLTETSSKAETGSINLADSALMQIQAFGTGGEIAFDTGASAGERVRIKDAGLAIGNNLNLDILDGAGDVSMRLNNLSSGSNSGRISIDPDNSAASSTLAVFIDGTEEARIDTDGLKFNGDTAAANALSDYEEGTWTPTAAKGASSITVGSGTPVYVKIGSFVHVQVYLTGSSGGNSDQLWIGGLPFTPIGSALNAGAVMYQNINLDTGRSNIVAYIPSSTSHIRLYQGGDNNGWYGTTGNDVGNSFNAIISISYRTSA